MTDATARLFVAVEVPAPVRGAIAAATRPVRRKQPDARWVDRSALHLTVAFVGEVGEEGTHAVESACAEASAAVGPFDLTMSGTAGTFGRGVLWAGLMHSPALDRLSSVLRGAMVERGLPVEERPFHAHVTLARAVRGGHIRTDAAAAYGTPQLSWRVERIALMRSHLRPGGARYSVAAVWLLERGR